MKKEVIVEAYELPVGAKCTFWWGTYYEFLGMDWMYGRFQQIGTDKIWCTYWKFVYDEEEDLYRYRKDQNVQQ